MRPRATVTMAALVLVSFLSCLLVGPGALLCQGLCWASLGYPATPTYRAQTGWAPQAEPQQPPCDPVSASHSVHRLLSLPGEAFPTPLGIRILG